MELSQLDLVTPDPALRQAIGEQLGVEGAWQVATFETLAKALAAWRERSPQAIVLDEALVGNEAPKIAEAVQSCGLPTPFFVLGGGEALASLLLVESFPKPLRLGHLLARLSFYRQIQSQGGDVAFQLGAYRFLPRARQLTAAGGEIIKLTDKESALLECLCSAEAPMPRDELLAAVWGYEDSVDTHTLETHIYRLRRAVPDGRDLFIVENGSYRINPAWRAS